MTRTSADDEQRELWNEELPRRRDAIRAEETGQIPVVRPAEPAPEAESGSASESAPAPEAAAGSSSSLPEAPAAEVPHSSYGHGLVTPPAGPPTGPLPAEATAAATASPDAPAATASGTDTAASAPASAAPATTASGTATPTAAPAGQAADPQAAAAGAPAPQKDYGRAGRNLPAAIGVGVILGGGVLASLLFYPPSFVAIALIGVVAAMWELANALSRSGSVVARIPTVTTAGLMVLSTALSGREALWVAFTVGAGAILLFTLLEKRPNPVKDVCLSLFALTYVGLMASAVIYLLTLPRGNLLVILFLALVVASDIGGYAFGVLWGRHPIAPKISPKKSWEGYAGSALFSTAVGIGIAYWVFDAPIWTGIVLGVVIPAFATLGDFSESMIKRDLDLKDMGTLLPGHGGVMDRLDSILPTAPVALVLFTFLPGFIT